MLKRSFIIFCAFLLPFISVSQNDVESDVKKLHKFLQSIDSRYVDSVETSLIVEKGMRTMLEQLDPHSVYMNAEQYKRASEPLTGKFKGIGIRYQVILDTLTVIQVLAGSPAEKGELKIGDQILKIGDDSLSAVKLASSEMSVKIKAKENIDKPLYFLRNGQLQQVVLDRDDVTVSSVSSHFMLREDVGYIKLDRFSSTSLVDFRRALESVKKQGAKSLVFDLRGNSGGYLSVAIKIVDEFLEDRKLIVYTEGVNQSKKETFATSGGKFTKGELIILIDQNSASASEIVAGAIQDWDRGLVVGRRSYGKGLVQRAIEFDDGSAMRLTISRYYTPTGRSIQKPYTADVKSYRSDIRQRISSGELYSRDSIKLADSLVFTTPLGRKVYGGGGIVPDEFVPADSAFRNDFVRKLNASRLNYRYALQYVAKHGDELDNSYADIEAFVTGFQPSDADIQFLRMQLAIAGKEVEDVKYEEGKAEVRETLKELIARFHYGMNAYYFTMASTDPVVEAAMIELDNNTFRELGLK